MVRDPSIAKLGSRRATDAFRTTAAANAVAQNSLENAVERLAQSTAEAARRNPSFAASAADDIATLLADFPPARKGAFLETIARNQGDDFAREVAAAMRNQHRAALRAGASSIRAWAGRMLTALQAVGVGYEVYQAGSALKDYAEALQAAMDPNLSDAEADALFAKAQAAAARMVLAGGLGTLFELNPKLGAAMGAFVISFYGTRVILENTETGQKIDLAVTDFIDRHTQAAERFVCDAQEFFGYESECERLREVDRRLLGRVLAGIREGRWQLAEGKTMLDVLEAINLGRYADLDRLLVPSDAWQTAEETLAGLEEQLVGLQESCGTAGSRPESAAAAPSRNEALLRACMAAGQAVDDTLTARRVVESLAERALQGLRAAERGIASCAGLPQLDRAFATAQTASSHAADAARAFGRLLKTVDVADQLAQDARRGRWTGPAGACRDRRKLHAPDQRPDRSRGGQP